MECAEVLTVSDLNYCQGEDAILHIGEAENYPGLTDGAEIGILFTRLSDGRETVITVNADTLPELIIDTELFTPVDGYVYQVQATFSQQGGGVIPMRIKPFTFTGGVFTVSSTAYDGLLVRFVKVFTVTPTVSTAFEQWLSSAEV